MVRFSVERRGGAEVLSALETKKKTNLYPCVYSNGLDQIKWDLAYNGLSSFSVGLYVFAVWERLKK